MFKRRLSRREFLKTAAGAAAGMAVLSACGPAATTVPAPTTAPATAAPTTAAATMAPTTAPTSSGPVKLTVWDWYDETKDVLNKAASDFTQANPNIIVTHYVDDAVYLTDLTAQLTGGVGPDIFGPNILAMQLGQAGRIIDLIPALGEDFLATFFAPTRRQFTANGKQYAMGWMAQTLGFFYNPALFAKAGITNVPETWDDFITVCQKIKAAGIIPWSFGDSDKWEGGDFFLPFITQAADNQDLTYELDDHTQSGISWNSQPVIDALTMFDKLMKAQITENGVNGTAWQDATTLFYGGKAAMFYSGSWQIADIATNAPKDLASSYQIFENPAWAPGKRHWCADQAGAAFSVNAEGHIPESLQFIKYIYDPQRYSTMMNTAFSMPSTIAGAKLVQDPHLQLMTSWMVDGCNHILFGKGSSDAVTNNIQNIIDQSKTPAQVAAQIEKDVLTSRSQ